MSAPNTVRVFTYNIHKGFTAGRLQFILPLIREALHLLKPDLVCLQEVRGQPDSQYEILANPLWPHHVYGKNAVYPSGNHGNAILSCFPFLTQENIHLTQVKRASRSLLHVSMMVHDWPVPLHLICVHFGLFKSERDRQFNQLIQRIHEVPAQLPLIIAGDFNDWRGHAMGYLEKALGVKEAFKERKGQYEKTFPALRPTLRIDRIYFRGLHLETTVCLKKKPWRLLSDHLPLYAVFSMPRSV